MKHVTTFEKFNLSKKIKGFFGYKDDDKIILALIEKIKSEAVTVYYQDVSRKTDNDYMRSSEYECIYEFSVLDLNILVYLSNSNRRGKKAGLATHESYSIIIIDNIIIDCGYISSDNLVKILKEQTLVSKNFGAPTNPQGQPISLKGLAIEKSIDFSKIEKGDIDLLKKDIYLIFSS